MYINGFFYVQNIYIHYNKIYTRIARTTYKLYFLLTHTHTDPSVYIIIIYFTHDRRFPSLCATDAVKMRKKKRIRMYKMNTVMIFCVLYARRLIRCRRITASGSRQKIIEIGGVFRRSSVFPRFLPKWKSTSVSSPRR